MSEVALDIRHVSRRFGGLLAVDDVSLEVKAGGITALVGPNGAGKTTLFNTITNVFPPSSGRVSCFGATLAGRAGCQIARLGLIRTFQSARVFPGMTVLENVLAGGHMQLRAWTIEQMLLLGRSRLEERLIREKAKRLLHIAGLAALADAPATNLPMGAQKVLEVIRALMAKPRLLLLDEPAAGLNDSETAELARLLLAIRASGTTIMIVEHNMSLVMSVADQIAVLDAGRLIADGSPHEVRANPSVIKAYLGQECA